MLIGMIEAVVDVHTTEPRCDRDGRSCRPGPRDRHDGNERST